MSKPQNRAFTLIELLVVIAIIALLIGILLPALGTARATAWKIVDATQIRSLLTGQLIYMNDNDEQFAGPNTSGWGERPGPNQSNNRYLDETTSSTPTSTFDWISVVIGEELNFSANRAERTANIFNDFADPAAREFNQLVFGSAADRADFEQILTQGRGFKQASYLSPAVFHFWQASRGGFVGGGFVPDETAGFAQRFGGVPYIWDRPISSQVETVRGYRPRLSRVGTQVANKILIADGTRFLTSDLTLDFDINPTPNFFGSFTTGTPQWVNNNSYGKFGDRGALNGENVALSFRHVGESINTGYFDGHVDNLTKQEVWEDPTPWHPTGATIVDTTEFTEEFRARGMFENGDKIP